MSIITIYWFLVLIAIAVLIEIAYRYDAYIKAHGKNFVYGSLIVLCTFICLGVFGRIINSVMEISTLQEQQVETVNETNASLAEGMYYLGVEIVGYDEYIQDAEYHYVYEFGVVDDETYDGHTYLYETTQVLDTEIPYLLVMDSLNTDNVEDDGIVTVWSWVY